MRFAFWRRREDKAVPVESVSAIAPEFHEPKFRASDPTPFDPAPRRQTIRETLAVAESGDLDLRVIGRTLMRRKWWVILPTLLALGASVEVLEPPALRERVLAVAEVLVRRYAAPAPVPVSLRP